MPSWHSARRDRDLDSLSHISQSRKSLERVQSRAYAPLQRPPTRYPPTIRDASISVAAAHALTRVGGAKLPRHGPQRPASTQRRWASQCAVAQPGHSTHPGRALLATVQPQTRPSRSQARQLLATSPRSKPALQLWLAMTTWQPDPVHLVEPVGHAGNAAAQSYRQITAIHRTSAGGLRHPDVDGSRCISGTPAAQRMSRTVSAADFFTPGTTCLARVLAGPSRCTRAVHWARNVACRALSSAEGDLYPNPGFPKGGQNWPLKANFGPFRRGSSGLVAGLCWAVLGTRVEATLTAVWHILGC